MLRPVLFAVDAILIFKVGPKTFISRLSKYRECHIQGDFLLIYEKHNDVLLLVMVNIGTHHELFGT